MATACLVVVLRHARATLASVLAVMLQTARMHPIDGIPSASGSPQDLLLSGSANMEAMFDGPGAGSGRWVTHSKHALVQQCPDALYGAAPPMANCHVMVR